MKLRISLPNLKIFVQQVLCCKLLKFEVKSRSNLYLSQRFATKLQHQIVVTQNETMCCYWSRNNLFHLNHVIVIQIVEKCGLICTLKMSNSYILDILVIHQVIYFRFRRVLEPSLSWKRNLQQHNWIISVFMWYRIYCWWTCLLGYLYQFIYQNTHTATATATTTTITTLLLLFYFYYSFTTNLLHLYHYFTTTILLLLQLLLLLLLLLLLYYYY